MERMMRLRPYIPETDFEIIRNWIADPRSHALWCANRFAYPLSRENFDSVLEEIRIRNGDCAADSAVFFGSAGYAKQGGCQENDDLFHIDSGQMRGVCTTRIIRDTK